MLHDVGPTEEFFTFNSTCLKMSLATFPPPHLFIKAECSNTCPAAGTLAAQWALRKLGGLVLEESLGSPSVTGSLLLFTDKTTRGWRLLALGDIFLQVPLH